jgi:ABC-type polar amino acid transport system ATPase subunit
MPPYIEVEGLSKRFGTHKVISDLSLKIDEGERVIFQGPSGIGKSTFLRCLTYLEPFQSGIIKVGNLTVQPGMDEYKDHKRIVALRQQLGFVFQFFNLFPHLNVIENLMLGPVKVLGQREEEVRGQALRLLERVGLKEKAQAYPAALSGGQQQRVGIARALAMRPKAILFDEPTSALDPEMKEDIVEVIEDFAKEGLTLLIVTHEPAVIQRIATRIIQFGPQCRIVSDRRIAS